MKSPKKKRKRSVKAWAILDAKNIKAVFLDERVGKLLAGFANLIPVTVVWEE